MESKIKLLKVLDIISATDKDHPITASQLCALLKKDGVSAERKSVCRDINTLIKHGYKIVLCADNKKGYYMTEKPKKAESAPRAEKVRVTLYYDQENEAFVEKTFGKKASAYDGGNMCAEFSVEEGLLFSKLLEAGNTVQIVSPEDTRDEFIALLQNAQEFYNKPRGKKKIDYWLL